MEQLFPDADLHDLDFNSPDAFAKIKAFYAETLTDPERSEVAKAASATELEAILDRSFGEGQRVTLRINRTYKGLDRSRQSVDVWTDFMSDCGVQFRKGETYVVYARNEDGKLKTGACSRTHRLSEAGDDLVYLHFLENGDPDRGRIWGFVSGDERAPKVPHIFDPVPLPISDLDVQLHSGKITLQAWTDQKGQYVFDGLPEGDYEIHVAAERRKVHLEPKACKSEGSMFQRKSPASKAATSPPNATAPWSARGCR